MEWIVDTGASNHMASNLQMLKAYRLVPQSDKSIVHLPTGNIVSVTHRGLTYDLFSGQVKAVPKYTDKFASRAIPTVLMGNVMFQESIFPFKQRKFAGNPVFPVLDILSPMASNDTKNQPVACSPGTSNSLTQGDINSPPSSTAVHEESSSTEANPTLHITAYNSSPLNSDTAQELMRYGRPSRPYVWLQDYVTKPATHTCPYPISSYVTYSKLTIPYQHLLALHSAIPEPKSFKEVVSDPNWVKYRASGEVERYKARLVAKGYNHKEGLDYTETFSPVAKMVPVRSVIALAASLNWQIYQMDVHHAFLNGDLLEEVYLYIPEGFCRQGETQKVCKL
uniref:Reverse transcriptase Ty1/copia-type domain-containing protein n=1 Tax=Nicotiana tabacum TaxID=4097 RepID=A0A1S3XBV9_TOBAC|nr:PREDICTED: uncharacterized protein LOC107763414 [Nicotiana tabacum]